MNNLFVGTLVLLGMLALLSLIYGLLWVILNCFFPIDYWTLSGCLSTLMVGMLVVWKLDV